MADLLGSRQFLQLHQPLIETAFMRHQLGMAAALDQMAMVEHDDLIGGANRREPVRDCDDGDLSAQGLQRFADDLFGGTVDIGGGFIEKQDSRCAGQGACHRDQLLLSG